MPLTAASAPPLPRHQRWQRAVRKEFRAGYPKGQLDIIARSLPRSANSHIFDLDEFALSGPGAFRPFSVQVFRTSGPSKGQGKNGNGKKIIQHTEQSATDTTHKRIEVRKAGVTPLTAASAPPLPRHQRWQRAVRKEFRAGYPKGQLDIIARSLPRSANSHICDLDEFALSGPDDFNRA